MVLASIILTATGLIIAAVGVSMYRHYSGLKVDQAFNNAADDRRAKLDSINLEFGKTMDSIQSQSAIVTKRITDEADSIIKNLKEKSSITENAINNLGKQSKIASDKISDQVDEVIDITEIKLPVRISAYKDAQRFLKGMIFSIKKMYDRSVPIRPPKTIEEFLSNNSIDLIYKFLDTSCDPQVLGMRTYEAEIRRAFSFLVNKGENILSKYPQILDPEAYQLIYDLIESQEINGLKNISYNKVRKVVPDDKELQPILGSLVVPLGNEQKENLMKLYDWCRKENKELREYGIEESLLEIYTNRDFNQQPPCMIAVEKVISNKIRLKKGK